MITVARQAAVEMAPFNIRVTAIAPGPFLTNIGEGRPKQRPELRKLFSDIVPLGRLAQVDEIKGLAPLPASPAGSFITGTVIPIDGGATCVSTRGNYTALAASSGPCGGKGRAAASKCWRVSPRNPTATHKKGGEVA